MDTCLDELYILTPINARIIILNSQGIKRTKNLFLRVVGLAQPQGESGTKQGRNEERHQASTKKPYPLHYITSYHHVKCLSFWRGGVQIVLFVDVHLSSGLVATHFQANGGGQSILPQNH